MSAAELAGIHHVKIPVTDLDRSLAWYQRVFGFEVTMDFPEADGVVRGVAGTMPGLGDSLVAFRVNPNAAKGCRGFDPVSFAVRDRDALEKWVARLDEAEVDHSPVIEASIGWLLVFDDPDGLTLHLYTWAEHGIDQSAQSGYGRRTTAQASR